MSDYQQSVLNKFRASRAMAGLESYAGLDGVSVDTPEESALVLSDLLCDLMHLCAQRGVDFEARLEAGREHFAIERWGDDRA